MVKKTKADKPVGRGDKQYHLETKPGDIAEHCLLVGSPERATMIAENFFKETRQVGDHRGLKSYTGICEDVQMSVVTTGMGSASTGIVLPEAARCGARRFIRVGSCSTLWKEPKIGESAIASAAVRLEGASKNWAPPEYPAYSDYRVVSALVKAATNLGLPHYVGVEATTDDFNEGQARPDDIGHIPPRLFEQHKELTNAGVLLYSMESSAIFVWCSTHGHIYDPENGIWAGSVNAIYGNRQTNEFGVMGDEAAAKIAVEAMILLYLDTILDTVKDKIRGW